MTLCTCGYPLTADGACPWCASRKCSCVCPQCDAGPGETHGVRGRCIVAGEAFWCEHMPDDDDLAAAPTGTEEGRDG